MLIHFGLFVLCLSCVCSEGFLRSEPGVQFSLWPVHNAATFMRLRRESQTAGNVAGPNEGVSKPTEVVKPPATEHTVPNPPVDNAEPKNNETSVPKHDQPSPVSGTANTTTHNPPSNTNINQTLTNTTIVEKTVKQLDLNNPGVVKRGLIVFGGFALMAAAYFIFYRRKNKSSEQSNSHSMIDANQFRYGVLQSEDKRDTELSRIPLTMESDDEEDEDLEIFDLEQKKKSLSYVNLQTNDEDVVLSPRDSSSIERDNLLLDIEDVNSETLINWSSNGSKSIL